MYSTLCTGELHWKAVYEIFVSKRDENIQLHKGNNKILIFQLFLLKLSFHFHKIEQTGNQPYTMNKEVKMIRNVPFESIDEVIFRPFSSYFTIYLGENGGRGALEETGEKLVIFRYFQMYKLFI